MNKIIQTVVAAKIKTDKTSEPIIIMRYDDFKIIAKGIKHREISTLGVTGNIEFKIITVDLP